MVKRAGNAHQALRAGRSLVHIGLSVTFRKPHELACEDLCDAVVAWIKERSNRSRLFSERLSQVMFHGFRFSAFGQAWEHVDGERIVSFRSRLVNYCMAENTSVASLIDFLFFIELKLWKSIRLSLRELYISTLLADPYLKKQLAMRFATNYVKLATNFLNIDREPPLNIVFLSVQLFTTPSIAAMLVAECDLLERIWEFLRSYLTSGDEVSQARINSSMLDCESEPFQNRRYFHFFQDLRYVFV